MVNSEPLAGIFWGNVGAPAWLLPLPYPGCPGLEGDSLISRSQSCTSDFPLASGSRPPYLPEDCHVRWQRSGTANVPSHVRDMVEMARRHEDCS